MFATNISRPTARRGRNYLEFFKIFMNIGTELSTLSMGQSICICIISYVRDEYILCICIISYVSIDDVRHNKFLMCDAIVFCYLVMALLRCSCTKSVVRRFVVVSVCESVFAFIQKIKQFFVKKSFVKLCRYCHGL